MFDLSCKYVASLQVNRLSEDGDWLVGGPLALRPRCLDLNKNEHSVQSLKEDDPE
jgi:hypothetical protein